MHRIRIIPVLLLQNKGLCKTVKFKQPNYIGDPINAVRIFNEKEVDEIVILDIKASQEKREPDYAWIKSMCGEAFMPLGYGGGITSCSQAVKLFQSGVEKIILNSALQKNYSLITEVASEFGTQSTVVCIDYRKKFLGGNRPAFFSGSVTKNISLVDFAKDCENAGAGEIMLQNIDRDGTFSGLDLEIIEEISSKVKVPVIACSGLRSLEDARQAIEHGASAVAGGSFFVYRNNDPRSILINYPAQHALNEVIFSQLSV